VITLQVHNRQVINYAFHPAREELLVVCADGLLIIKSFKRQLFEIDGNWRKQTQITIRTRLEWALPSVWFSIVNVAADVDLIIAAARCDLYVWSFADGSLVAFGAKMHTQPITCSCHQALSNNCELRIVTGDAEGAVKVWNVSFLTKTFIIFANLQAHTGSVLSLIMDHNLGCLYAPLLN
jgi:WD40 repeat protein